MSNSENNRLGYPPVSAPRLLFSARLEFLSGLLVMALTIGIFALF